MNIVSTAGIFIAVALGAAGELRAQADGSLRWPLKTGSTSQFPFVESSPAVGPDGTIYVGVGYDTTPQTGAVFAIDRNGNLKVPKPFLTPEPVNSSPIVAPDGKTIYVGCEDGNLYALNPDLTKKWVSHADGNSFVYSSPAIGADGTIYFCSGDYSDPANSALYAVTPEGQRLWKATVGDFIESSPTIAADGTILFGSYDKNIYAFNPSGSEKWRVPTNGEILASAAMGADGTVFIGSSDGLLYALYPDGQTKWTFPTQGIFVASPVIGADGTIYVGSTNSNFYALKPDGPADSRVKWIFEAPKPINSTAAVRTDGSIIFGCQDGHVYALNPDDGTVRWSYLTDDQVNSSPVVAADGSIYVGSSDGKLYAFNGTVLLSIVASWPMFQRDATHSGRVRDASADGQLLSLSTRALAGSGKNLIAGFIVQGAGSKVLLLRGIGPTLAQFTVANPLADPTLTLKNFPSGFTVLANDNWGSAGDARQIIDASTAVGAFALPPGSKDAVLYTTVPSPGTYTALIDSANGGSGVALVEVYDADVNLTSARLTALSIRGSVGTGEDVLIAGLSIGGNGPLRVLVRAVGPTLGVAPYNVPGVLAQPVLTVYSGQTAIRQNIGWTSDGYKADLAGAAQAVGDFALTDGSADCAVLLTLDRGPYTIQVSGVGGTTGEALVEVYAVP
jgi:outer membrane protein assembly factor BamB